MKFPYNTEDGKSAPAPDKGAPASIDQVLSKRPLRIGGPEDLTDKERKLIYRNMPKEPVEGEEFGMEKKQSKVYKKKFADGGEVDADAKELLEYRKRPDYFGYEDYTPSGRAAISAYNKADMDAKDRVKRKGAPPYSPSAASKAQSAQREAASEIKRETRGTVKEGRYAKGGSVSSRADGCAQRGKTKGKVI